MPCSPQIISEMQSEIHSMEKFDFLKPIIHSQTIQFSVRSLLEESAQFENEVHNSFC